MKPGPQFPLARIALAPIPRPMSLNLPSAIERNAPGDPQGEEGTMETFGVIVTTVLSSGGLVLALAWLIREWITVRLSKRVQHDFDVKLNAVEIAGQREIATLSAQLRDRGTAIEMLQKDAFGAAATRRNAMDAKRIAALEALWVLVQRDLRKLQSPAMILTWINYRAAAEIAERHKQLQDMFSTMLPNYDKTGDVKAKAAEGQPYVTPEAWSLFVAYNAIVMFGILQVEMLAKGVNRPEFFNYSAVEALIVAALPHRADEARRQGPSCYGNLLDELEGRLLATVKAMVDGTDLTDAALAEGTRIIELSNAGVQRIDATTRAAIEAQIAADGAE